MKRRVLFGLLIALLIASGCGRKEPPETKETSTEEGKSGSKQDSVEHKVLSFNLEGLTERGEKKWEVIGRTAQSISENEIRLGNIVAKTYGDQEAVITADHGIYDKSKNDVTLEKNVVATIDNAGSVIKDQIGLVSAQGEQSKAADTRKGKKRIVITCDGDVIFNYAKNLACFNKNVKVKSEDGDIDADKITVNLDPSTKKINDIVAEGHVKITQKENIAFGNSAKYSEADKTVSLKGNPKIVMTQEGNSVIKEKFVEK